MADELEKEEEKNSTGQHMNGFQNENGIAARNGNQPHLDESFESMGGADSMEEEEWLAENDTLFEEMLGVDPLMRTEVEMLQKEKETWGSELKQLEREKRELREQKEAFER